MRVALIAASLVALATPAAADTVSEFYKGKSVSLMVSGSAGGGYDLLARAIAKHLGKHIPGNPAVVVKNVPGAGGLLLTNQIYNVLPKDGTVIGSVQNNVPFEPLYGTKEADYDPNKMIYLGSPGSEVSIITVWHGANVATLAEARKRELTMGSSGQNSTPSFYARLANATLGTKLKIVVGYPGQNDVLFAMERGEVDGHPSAFYNSLMASRPNWIKDRKVHLLVQFGAAKEPAIADVPLATELAANPEDRRLIEEASAPLAIGRPYVMAPGVPADRVAALRKAFADTVKDPEFQADSERAQLGANQLQPGESLQATIARSYAAPPAVIERLRKLQQ